MKRFVSLILSVCFLFSINAYGYPSQINGADARYRMCKWPN